MVVVGDCRLVLAGLESGSVDAVVCDPPYELGFMGKSWDASGVAYDVGLWAEVLRVLKPGGHLLAFGGSRTYHRLACAVEDAGFEIRDQIMWVYGSGFPKSLDVSKALDKAAGAPVKVGKAFKVAGEYGGCDLRDPDLQGADRDAMRHQAVTDAAQQWSGWGTALKPAHEPIVVARKPLDGTVANNVLSHGVGGLNIDGCRVGGEVRVNTPAANGKAAVASVTTGASNGGTQGGFNYSPDADPATVAGRWPANFIHDGSDEVLTLFPDSSGGMYPAKRGQAVNTTFASGQETEGGARKMGDSGSAARFFYCAKAGKKERNHGAENKHPTVKPVALMRYLVRLVTPPDGLVLDPFTGSGTTGIAAKLEGFNFIGIEQDAEYAAIAERRIASW